MWSWACLVCFYLFCVFSDSFLDAFPQQILRFLFWCVYPYPSSFCGPSVQAGTVLALCHLFSLSSGTWGCDELTEPLLVLLLIVFGLWLKKSAAISSDRLYRPHLHPAACRVRSGPKLSARLPIIHSAEEMNVISLGVSS